MPTSVPLTSKQQKLKKLLADNPNHCIGLDQGRLYILRGVPVTMISDNIIDDLIQTLEEL